MSTTQTIDVIKARANRKADAMDLDAKTVMMLGGDDQLIRARIGGIQDVIDICDRVLNGEPEPDEGVDDGR